jgi:hypothetical protein
VIHYSDGTTTQQDLSKIEDMNGEFEVLIFDA